MRFGLRPYKQKPLGGLRVRKLADTTDGERVVRHHPITGEKMLVRPETVAHPEFTYETMQADPWPLAGLAIEGDPPERCFVGNRFVDKAIAEGWATLEGARLVHRPAGPPDAPWNTTHTFRHGDTFVLHTVDGDLRYRILENPDKWPEWKHDGTDEGFGGDVRWTYELELEDG